MIPDLGFQIPIFAIGLILLIRKSKILNFDRQW